MWLFSTGILGGYIPESMVMQYIYLEVIREVIAGYCAPFTVGVHGKASVGRFAHIVPGIPDFVLDLRDNTARWAVEDL